MRLDITPLEDALKTLEDAENAYRQEINNIYIRDSVVKRYEYTYSMAIKMLKRFLENFTTELDADTMTFKEFIRTGAQRGLLLGDVQKWDDYRTKRNKTSHAYKVDVALDVVSVVPDFIKEVKYLVGVLNERINH
ncbi:MAG: nucleotidyltransferase substrate binding protein [Heliobacteriaceae bacterium]|jgi:nucleotidyltransferase substrate binding protein (TIGR01987 family)|nr:nucleotidyltransferase substrate binding protein [Heliobacteriaceae bacterium]